MIEIRKYQSIRASYIASLTAPVFAKVDDALYQSIDDLITLSNYEFQQKYGNIFNSENNAFEYYSQFQDSELKQKLYETMFSFDESKRDYYLAKYATVPEFDSVVLCVTESCNMRCTYCCYGGGYDHRRKHSLNKIDFDSACHVIDKMCAGLSTSKNKDVSFYGGEPLLEYFLIKRIVEYCKTKKQYSFIFAMTTNGTLLNDEIINYLIDNNFQLTVSMDYHHDYHDSRRVFANGGKTYSNIIKKLTRIKQISRDFYYSNLGFSTVVDTLNDYYHIISRTKNLKHNYTVSLRSGSIVLNDKDKKIVKDNSLTFESEIKRTALSLINKKVSLRDIDSSYWNYIFTLKKIHEFYCFKQNYENSCLMGGMCYPIGKNRLFVTVDGCLKICEKLDWTPSIGNAVSGIDVGITSNLLNKYFSFKNEVCHQCEIRYFCGLCFAHLLDEKNREFDLKRECVYCATEKHKVLFMLNIYFELVDTYGLAQIKEIF